MHGHAWNGYHANVWQVNIGLGNDLVPSGIKQFPEPILTKSYDTMSMDQCKKDVTPLLTHWSYVFLTLTHRYVVNR